MAWELVIGLEVHAQLRTESKLFGPASAAFGGAPNSHVDAVSLGLPGALPVLNKEAVRMAAIAGLATNCEVQRHSVFARKNYFYPDLPKGYQISQFDKPICLAGHLDIDAGEGPRRIRITRIHMEEDAGKSSHRAGGSYVDLNRAGVPLIEIVSEPDLRSADEAVAYLKELRAILIYIGVNDGNLEEGSFRCDANVSVRRVGQTTLGTRCEIKNLNSFRGIRDAIGYESARQIRQITAGETIIQQTRLWDVDKGRTAAMRSKEQAHDYRYFPDPDLPPLLIAAEDLTAWAATIPELPAQRRSRFVSDLGLDTEMARLLCEDPETADRYERTLGQDQSPERARSLASFLTGRLAGALNKSERSWADIDTAMTQLAEVHDQWRDGKLSNKMLTDVLVAAFAADASFADALESARDHTGLIEQDDGALDDMLAAIIAANPGQVAAYRSGKHKLIGFFVGQVMRQLQGKANAKVVNAKLKALLDG
ncbi:MAG: Asp-tRNA(Asn)/Glu-tRNA(Gln) amidotransferase subunit GatB [Myxococcales bacterium]|nr:Asp-tRNA(Asn)/Glu-tRNA(Gln) amidotransferase subunit GatB [Myxococcales bacterium]